MPKPANLLLGPELLWVLFYALIVLAIKVTGSPTKSMDPYWENLGWIVTLVFSLLKFALLVRVFSSWFGAGRYNSWIRWSYQLTDWLVEPLRRVIPPLGMIDVSPIAAYFVLWLLQRLVMGAIL